MKKFCCDIIDKDIFPTIRFINNLDYRTRLNDDEITVFIFTGKPNFRNFVKMLGRFHHNYRKKVGGYMYKHNLVLYYFPDNNFDNCASEIGRIVFGDKT